MSEYITEQIGSATVTRLAAPAPMPAPVPTVTRRQALRALHDAGLLSAIETKIGEMDEPARGRALIDWENATEFRRDFPLLLAVAGSLGLTSAQIDDLFAAAASIT